MMLIMSVNYIIPFFVSILKEIVLITLLINTPVLNKIYIVKKMLVIKFISFLITITR